MTTKISATIITASILLMMGLPFAYAATKVKAIESTGFGFSMTSDEFGNPCSTIPGEYPALYDNATNQPVDVTVKLVNLGPSILFIDGTGFVIPPQGNQVRPRIVRLTLAPGTAFRVKPQTSDCAWAALVLPH